ncbi:TraR/DksA family transcriptional regulator [Rhodobacter aestuarii]|uniref:Transcriptional regulator, TraR/DksA family n=1 Tax=Rhodobacter aestuarii TaxID=453582 RepID=A0A1N7NXY7_9RHOB|nr:MULTISPECIES: TraR/DksA family transcriptional regulator [Rhodobacter]PTV94479.1 TraR/DksA family transcriptional regulator [Rhodobacter aestuarii]SIT03099.1 transcriptional regulator, TraR/DksA family [Rhodobacter aestuarii]SOC12126.1 TraR/DksA family transcriptional regulator [Rhodobacter sp. JA431]
MTPAIKSDETRRAELLARKNQLETRIDQISGEFEEHDSKDWEEMATEREGDEVLEDLGAAAQNELRMIEAALTRMESDDYGYCVICGERIPEERLDLIPATPFCAEHAARH